MISLVIIISILISTIIVNALSAISKHDSVKLSNHTCEVGTIQ